MKRKTKCEDALKKDIIQSTKDIRQKFKKLKLALNQEEEVLSRTLKPIVDPLNTLVKHHKNATAEKPSDYIPDNEEEREKEEKVEEEEEEPEINLESSQNYYKTPKGYKSAQQHARAFGVFASKYVLYLLEPSKEKVLDRVFGIRANSSRWLLGDSEIKIADDVIYIDGQEYQGTPGLFELLFMKNPDNEIYNENDLKVYKKMLMQTSAHKQGYSMDRQINSSKSKKYINIIKPLFQSNPSGSGMQASKPRYEYWDDPNELVDRLRLLLGSQSAGHNNHQNEILAIIEELREADIIA